MKYAREITYIRQLCCLGLGGEAIIPAVFKALHKLVPSSTQTFFWLDIQGNIQKGYQQPFTPDLSKLYFSEFYGKRELEAWPGLKKLAAMPTGDVGFCIALPDVDQKRFYQSDFFNLYLRPRESDAPVYMRIRENKAVTGLILLGRGVKNTAFTSSELELLDHLRAYLSHALHRTVIDDINYVDSGESGLLIVNPDSEIVFISPHAKEILYYVDFPHSLGNAAQVLCSPKVSLPLQQMIKNLKDTFTNQVARPPVLIYQNTWGKFIFRAYYLEQHSYFEITDNTQYRQSLNNALIGISIQHQEPLPIKLMRNMQQLALSTREKEICLLVVEGLSYPKISQRLTISVNTVKTIIESVYDKLGVSGQTALINKLMMN